ncbi:MAG: 16S rRNA (guanine(527)-N(7))-methyltransferase RsmG [Chloroflexota bacterium]|nr:16S rRNA (guanine(527)-N(7))-methyltransferase RsmG [Chloroflexota bacterium]MDE2951302.1 16S rRNA (guanine(527)-N(7))-methyltransferase RsmG [Chloroflexota bacterium]
MSMLAEYTRACLNLELSVRQLAQFEVLGDMLLDWNQRMNLTSITAPEDIVVKHFLDSLTLVKVVPQFDRLRLIDVGTGAGFPGLALAIAFPALNVTLLDSTAKKLRFIQSVGEELQLKNVRTIHVRAEDAGRDKSHRASYDIAVARAVARLPILMEYLLPLAKPEGQVIAMQGMTAYDDANSAAKAIDALGGELFTIEEVLLPTLDNPRYLIVIDKIKKTPRQYPRQPGTPTRDPIQ